MEKEFGNKVIVVLGNSILDVISNCAEPLKIDDKNILVGRKTIVPGGQAATPADLLSKLGHKVYFVGAIGNDINAEIVKKDFDQNGIDYSFSAFCAADHNAARIYVDTDGKRQIFIDTDERLSCAELSLEWLPSQQPDIIYIDGNEPELELRAAKMGRELGVPVVADFENLNLPHEFLDYVDVLIAPSQIILQLGASDDLLQANRNVLAMGFRAVVSTMGEDGCLGVCDDQVFRIQGIKVEVKDTTGAGDTFHAGFVDAMLRGYGFFECLKIANRIAAIKCQYMGGRIPKEEVRAQVPPMDLTPYNKSLWLRAHPNSPADRNLRDGFQSLQPQ